MVKQYYPADDVKKHCVRDCKKPKPTQLRKSIQPGTVLILLAGRFKGRRVIFLKQLQSGLLLVTGPFAVNGVPLRRINQAYAIPTSTKVDLSGLKLEQFGDSYFAKKKIQKSKHSQGFFVRTNELSEEDKKNIEKKKKDQIDIDKVLLEKVKKVEHLKKYLQVRFSLRKN